MDHTLSYATNNEADDYFNNRLSNVVWLDTTEQRKSVALRQATRLIDRLNFAGEKVSSAQALQFPRKNVYVDDDGVETVTQDASVPDDIKIACFEIAYRLLDGVDVDEEREALMATSHGMGNARTSYDRTLVPEHVQAGIPSATAWSYLRPYIRDPKSITLSRIS